MMGGESTWTLAGLVVAVALPILVYRLVTAHIRNARWKKSFFEAWIRQDREEAKPHLEAALKTAEEFGPKDLRLALTLNDLARLYHSEGREAEAYSLEKRALIIFEELWPWCIIIHPAINTIATLYRDQIHYKSNHDIRAHRLDVIESMESAVKRVAQVVASTDGELSLHYFDINIYDRALAIREKVLGSDNVLVASSLESRAESERILAFSYPEKCLKRALEIRKKVQGPYHPDVANTIEMLANRYFGERVHAYQRVLAIREEAWGPENPDLIPTIKCLASEYESLDQYDSAETLYERVLAIREKEFGSEHLEIVEDIYALAEVYRERSKDNESEALLNRALTIRENHYERALAICEKGHEGLEIVEQLYALADVYRSQSKTNKAEELLKWALSIREKHLGSEHPEVADSLDILAWFYDVAEEFGKAEPLLIRALKIREKSFGAESHEVAQSLEELAGLYIVQGHSSDAKPLLKRALEIRENIPHPGLAQQTVADRLIRRFWLHGYWHHHDCEPLLRRVLAIREVAIGRDNMLYDRNVEVYVNFLEDAGRDKDAKEIIEKYFTRRPIDP